MRRLLVLLFLALALAGTPLRMAEAAADFARSLAELTAPASMEQPDGGVGDEAEIATVKAGLAVAECSSYSFLPCCGFLQLSPCDFIRSDSYAAGLLPDRKTWLPTPFGQWHAWLQIFLF